MQREIQSRRIVKIDVCETTDGDRVVGAHLAARLDCGHTLTPWDERVTVWLVGAYVPCRQCGEGGRDGA